MQMPWFSGPEVVIVALAVLVLFFSDRLVDVGRSFGGAFRGFKQGISGEASNKDGDDSRRSR